MEMMSRKRQEDRSGQEETEQSRIKQPRMESHVQPNMMRQGNITSQKQSLDRIIDEFQRLDTMGKKYKLELAKVRLFFSIEYWYATS